MSFLPTHLQNLQRSLGELVQKEIAPFAQEIDRSGEWPERSMRALQREGWTSLHLSRKLGGLEEGLLGLAVVCEEIARECPSTALCFGMHCVGTAVIAAKATPEQQSRFLEPIAEGRHLTTLALAEAGSGALFYLPHTRLERSGGVFRLNGAKQFVTNGGHADSYVVSTLASVPKPETGEFSCVLVEKDSPGARWGEPWQGMGMRGNAARTLYLEETKIPLGNLLGNEGDQNWYVFEVETPYFLMAMSGSYLGVAQAALEIAVEHLRSRQFASGEKLGELPVPQQRLANIWMAVEKSRLLIYEAGRLGDLGDPQAIPMLLAAKADVAETAVFATNEAMTLCGGVAYRQNAKLAQLLRDARAAHVMAPTTDILKTWISRHCLGLPLV